MTKVAIQGGLGSYSHIAAQHIFGDDFELVQNTSFRDCFVDVSESKCDFSVIPFENSTHGSVHENYDLLSRYDLSILQEIYLKINFHLIGLPGAKLDEVKELYSHQVSMSQIKAFLESNPQIKPFVHSDNGRAVEYIKNQNDKTKTAAASRLACDIYGMKILRENIHDNPKNYTRFFVIARSFVPAKDNNKTSICFELKHEAGTLVKALKAFGDRGISLTKIESRPILNTVWEYSFYIDLLAGISSQIMNEAIEEARHVTKDLKVLGSYKSGEYIDT